MSEFIRINSRVYIPVQEVSFDAIRAQGSGGQNVNKVATAVHLRFDVTASSLPQAYKSRLLGARDRRISAAGVLVIKAQRFRSQEKNKQEALERLSTVIRTHTTVAAKRKSSRPSKTAKKRRVAGKRIRGKLKSLRSRGGFAADRD